MADTKVCSTCNIEKPLSEFYESDSGIGGVVARCKECCRKKSREHNKLKKEPGYRKKRTGRPHSDATRKKLSDTMKRIGNKPSREAIDASIIVNTGKHASEATRKKMSETQKKSYAEDPTRHKNHSEGLMGHPVSEATRIKLSIVNVGKKRDAATRKKMSDSANKRWEDPEEREKTSETQKKFLEEHPEHIEFLRTVSKGRKHTIPSRKKMGLKSKGKDNPRWNGGITPFRKQIHECFKMNIWRQAVFERDDYKDWFSGCSGSPKNPLEAHHIVKFSTIISKYKIKTLEDAEACEELWDVNNGITLLKTSHRAYHQMWGW